MKACFVEDCGNLDGFVIACFEESILLTAVDTDGVLDVLVEEVDVVIIEGSVR